MKITPQVSVIIPCFNQGHFLEETVASIRNQTFQNFEIIIVNDGSTDIFTNQLLQDYKHEKTTVLTTNNQGLASARNSGIRLATGEYILPLDADDRIGPEYLEKAFNILNSNPGLGIVYCRAKLFGAVETEWNLPEYSLVEMLQDNVIFCSALFRKSDWELVGGYDPGMTYGWEDYDFWLSLIENGRGVYQIPEYLFYYRVASDSMVRSKEKWQKVAMFKRIFEKHQGLFRKNIEVWIDKLLSARENYFTSRLYIDIGAGVSDTSSIGRKIEQGTSCINFQIEGLADIQTLRFDPVDSYAVVEIEKVVLEKNKNVIDFPLERLSSNSCLQDKNIFFFNTADPQIFLDCSPSELAALQRVKIFLRFHALGQEALVCISDRLQDRLRVFEQKHVMTRQNILVKTATRFLRSLRIGG